ncbi:MerR family transcriptional regulator [Limosilactobacillus sp. STM2_1]|uniref:MerR family transcriptional regulator n=1 Tax=Limosilactobacillus rudii TaxID=2759755 RepID=A0A7W3YNT3_9LACO|nr:MerR family transcriptional regulator [Limosilactobacillus rudii]MBB1079576.1 MerR family transcriptional regulator [Limosilactobacillus rudii]MBB1097622.1 MerR family transcriptional regulator [Limosilactobacillus rudii]MCD7134731.1 MerR family transcriptional regulator [Limosilactobacillus rudii]
MKRTDLMTISQFAKIVGTTRRTLIFYDQKGIFKPVETMDNGYRYYSYGQIYQINFILGLRELGLSVEEIKDYLNDNNSESLNKRLGTLKEKVRLRIKSLQQVLAILDQKEENNLQLANVDFYVAKRCFLPLRDFWCSDFKVDCSEQEIAQAYSSFYQQLGTGVMANKSLSGFLTDLPQARANQYADSGFRIIKEKSFDNQVRVPVINQPSGEYVVAKVENSGQGIEKGLAAIRQLVADAHLKIGADLWQFNLGVDVKHLGLTENSILAYRILH